jgi:hypothetical protein
MKKLILTLLVIVIVSSVYSQGKVEYIVKCSPAGFNVTYTNSGGNTEQRKVSTKDWSMNFIGKPGSFVSISAQAENENSNINVKIVYQGKVIEKANSNGDYVIASASGSLSDEKTFANVYLYNHTFIGVQSVFTYSPILEKPDMVNSENIGIAENGTVTIIEKYNDGYYKVSSGNIIGYLWAGWFKKE